MLGGFLKDVVRLPIWGMGALQSHDQQHTKHGKEIVIYSFKKFFYINYGRDQFGKLLKIFD